MAILNTAITGLNAFRSQLTTTSNNIANVNTEGYSKQVVDLSTLPETKFGNGYLGNGVKVDDVRRQFDQFLVDRVRLYTASSEENQIYLDRALRIDDIIADPDVGLSGALQSFFNSVQDVADNPISTATRDVMLSNANILANRFHSIYEFLEGMRTEINQDIKVLVDEANTITQSISELNYAIKIAIGSSGGKSPNELLDRRDKLITDLSELVSVSTVQNADGSVNVFAGNGQALVVDDKSYQLSTSINQAEPDRLNITLEAGGGINSDITNYLSGGKLGGYFRFRENVLDPTENAIGRLALGLGAAFNEQNRLGMDLNGLLGVDMFNVPDPINGLDVYSTSVILSDPNNNGSVSVTDWNIAELSTLDYELTYQGNDSWQLYERQTGNVSTLASIGGVLEFGGNAPASPMMTLDVSAAQLNDRYIIRPTRNAARAFELELTNATQIAAASPVGVLTNFEGSDTVENILGSGDFPFTVSDLTIDLGAGAGAQAVIPTGVYNTADDLAAAINSAAGAIIAANDGSGGLNITNTTSNPFNFGGIIDAPLLNVTTIASYQSGSAQISDARLISRDPANQLLSNDVVLTYWDGTGIAPSAGMVNPGFYIDTANYPADASFSGPIAFIDYAAVDSGTEYSVSLTGLGDFSFTVKGQPINGDSFTLISNSNNNGRPVAIGDNRNALDMGLLQQAKTMVNNSSQDATTSFVGLYSTLIGDVGSKTRQADINNESQSRLLDQATASYDEVSGVNLDEEAANLVLFQQAYQAASQAIRVSNQLFDTLLNSI